MQFRKLPLAAVLFVAAACGRDYAPRNVLLISLDTTRADHIGCYGAERAETPAIDRLAREGVHFLDVTAPAPTTLSSHTSMMTGSWPQTHGVVRNGYPVNEDNVMLAEMFRGAGYHTAAFLSSFVLASRFRFDQGFDHYDEGFDRLITIDRFQNERSSARTNEAVFAHLDSVDEDRLFLFVHYFDPHVPYEPPASFAKRFVEPGQPLESSALDVERACIAHQYELIQRAPTLIGVINDGLLPALIQRAKGTPLGKDEWLAALYAAEVASVDASIQELLDGLEDRGLLEDTLIIATGDHGETFWEHGDFWNHGLMVYETTVRVPWVMHFPDGRYRRQVSEPVSTVDLVPTLCELFGWRVPERSDGMSLVPLLTGSPTADTESTPFHRGPIYSQATMPGPKFETGSRWGNQTKTRCVRDGDWKYIWTPYLRLGHLYNLRRDPGERHDLLSDPQPGPEVRARRDEMHEILKQWVQTADPLPSGFDPSHDRELIRRLKDLGYAGGEESDSDPPR